MLGAKNVEENHVPLEDEYTEVGSKETEKSRDKY